MASQAPARRSILDADMATVGSWLAQGFDWWVETLAGMLPAALRRPANRPAKTVALAADGRIPGDAPPVRGAVLLLPRDAVLLRTVELPLEGGRRQAVATVLAEAERLLPVPPAALLLAARVAGEDRAGQSVTVELAALPLATGETLAREFAERRDGPPARIDHRLQSGAPAGADFGPAMRASGLLPPASRARARWWIAVGLFLALNLALVVWRDIAAVERLERLVAEQQPAVGIAERLQRRILRLDALATGAAARRGAGEPLALMGEIADRLPPGAWLQRLALEEGVLRLAGYRPREANVVAALRASPSFTDVRNAGATTLAEIPAGQPFEVAVRLAPAQGVSR
jgi:hypothetical protein